MNECNYCLKTVATYAENYLEITFNTVNGSMGGTRELVKTDSRQFAKYANLEVLK